MREPRTIHRVVAAATTETSLANSRPFLKPKVVRRWKAAALTLLGSAAIALGMGAGSAQAGNNYTIFHWDVLTVHSTFSGGPYVLSTDLGRRYRWYVDTAHSTRVTYNYQWDYSIFEAVDIAAHSQSWHNFTRSSGGIGAPGYDGFPVKVRGSVLCCGTLYDRNGYLEV